ncbi:hypothetical protein ACVFYP_22190 [Roseomonas sp. F4]
MDWISLILGLISAGLLPMVGLWLRRYNRNSALAQWAAGTAAAAGRVVVRVMAARERDPTAPLDQLVRQEALAEADTFLSAYRANAATLGASARDAASRIGGEAGRLLVAAPAALPPPLLGQIHDLAGVGRQ